MSMDIHLIDKGFEDVDGRDFKQINLLDDGFSLVGILRKEIVIEIFLNGIRHQVAELEAVTDSSWTSKKVVVECQLVGGQYIELSGTIIDPINDTKEHIISLSFLKSLFGFIDENNTLEA